MEEHTITLHWRFDYDTRMKIAQAIQLIGFLLPSVGIVVALILRRKAKKKVSSLGLESANQVAGAWEANRELDDLRKMQLSFTIPHGIGKITRTHTYVIKRWWEFWR
ncbi:hypothetical protein HN670_02620 [bacterium]|nr:hypothetical protein [bacterium]